jgi:chitosanase
MPAQDRTLGDTRVMRIALATVVAMLTLTAPAHAALTAEQHRIADALVSVFENGTPEIQYCFIEDIHDGRGFTAGRAGFTTATADLLDVAERYTAKVAGNPLEPYLPRLRELARSGSDATDGLDGFVDAWHTACKDPQLVAVQDQVVDDTYFQPSQDKARKVGLRQPLSLAEIYDAEIQHGGGDDHDGTPAMIKRATKTAGGTPRRHTASESKWTKAFLAVRRHTLLHATDPATREGWKESVSRVDCFVYMVKTKQWKLEPPVRIRSRDFNETLR